MSEIPSLEASDLTLSWDGGTTIVAQHINVCVHTSQTLCIVGKSGCGKTTVLHALAGLTTPVHGKVYVHGKDVTGTPGQVSYMLQKDLLIASRRVIDNAALPLEIAGIPRKEARARARELLCTFGLEGTADLWPAQLSGGMRQRVAFLRTYLMGNDVVLLDEPFSALDAITRQELRTWYAQMSRDLGLSTVMITHDVAEALELGSQVSVLSRPSPDEPSSIVATFDVASDASDEVREALLELL